MMGSRLAPDPTLHVVALALWTMLASRAMAIAAAIVVVQIPLRALWLSRFHFGPVEWLWRRLTYGREFQAGHVDANTLRFTQG